MQEVKTAVSCQLQSGLYSLGIGIAFPNVEFPTMELQKKETALVVECCFRAALVLLVFHLIYLPFPSHSLAESTEGLSFKLVRRRY